MAGEKTITIEDVTERFKPIVELISSIFLDIGRTSIDFPSTTHAKYRYRESLYHRADAVVYHVQLLLLEQDKLEHNARLHEDDVEFLSLAERRLAFLFDDLVFNIASLFDYVAHAVYYLSTNGNQTPKTWSSLVKGIRGGNGVVKSANLKKMILETDQAFVNQFAEYRADLAHYSRQRSDVRVSRELRDFQADPVETVTLSVFLPKSLISKMKTLLRGRTDVADLTLPQTGLLLGYKSLVHVESILRELDAYVRPLTEEKMKRIYDEFSKAQDE